MLELIIVMLWWGILLYMIQIVLIRSQATPSILWLGFHRLMRVGCNPLLRNQEDLNLRLVLKWLRVIGGESQRQKHLWIDH